MILEENSSLEIIFLDYVEDGIECLRKNRQFIVMETFEPLDFRYSRK
jgi:hypothetical protein